MALKLIYPPRPKGKLSPTDLDYYEKSGKWMAQRKFRGSRMLLHVSPQGELTIANRHGGYFSRFSLDASYKKEIRAGLCLKEGVEYWLDGELMNKDVNPTNEIIFYDVLQVGRYLFGSPNQLERLDILREICGNPKELCHLKIALQISPRLWMAESFFDNFVARFEEAKPIQQLEGLVLRRKDSALDDFGAKEYVTTNIIRVRHSFAKDKGYEF